MSHRTHRGRLGKQHTERVFPEPAIWALVALGALCLAVAIVGCASPSPWPPSYPADYAAAARARCLGDGAPPPLGGYTSGGEIAACQTLVEGKYGHAR